MLGFVRLQRMLRSNGARQTPCVRVKQRFQKAVNARRGTLDASPLLRLPVGVPDYFFFAAFFATFLAAFFVAILPVLPVIKRVQLLGALIAANEGIDFTQKSVKKNRRGRAFFLLQFSFIVFTAHGSFNRA